MHARLVALALLAAACGQPASDVTPAPAATAASASVATPAAPAAAAAPVTADAPSAHPAPSTSPVDAPSADAAPSTSPIAATSRQLVTAVIADWQATTATLQRFRRDTGGPWHADGAPWTGVIGQGAAWGAGLHGDGPPSGQPGATKREGDGRTPAGAFALLATYGYAESLELAAALPYRASTPGLECVDDAASPHYTKILERTADTAWRSSERMRRRDELYRWVVEVAHNPRAVARAGSCIFLHVWRDARSPTVGCTAMPAAILRDLIGWFVRDHAPVYVLLPRAAYTDLAGAWGLPPLAP